VDSGKFTRKNPACPGTLRATPNFFFVVARIVAGPRRALRGIAGSREIKKLRLNDGAPKEASRDWRDTHDVCFTCGNTI